MKPYNKEEFVLLLFNPNYECIGDWYTAEMEIGKTYIKGRAHTSGVTEGFIDWEEFVYNGTQEHPHIRYIMKKK